MIYAAVFIKPCARSLAISGGVGRIDEKRRGAPIRVSFNGFKSVPTSKLDALAIQPQSANTSRQCLRIPARCNATPILAGLHEASALGENASPVCPVPQDRL